MMDEDETKEQLIRECASRLRDAIYPEKRHHSKETTPPKCILGNSKNFRISRDK